MGPFEIEYVEKLQWDLRERGQAPWEARAASGSSRLWGQAQEEATEKQGSYPGV